jgi:hypothetical protein
MRRLRLSVSSGMGGYFAVLYDGDGPIQTGVGYYTTPEEAAKEAEDWARAEGIAMDDICNRLLKPAEIEVF